MKSGDSHNAHGYIDDAFSIFPYDLTCQRLSRSAVKRYIYSAFRIIRKTYLVFITMETNLVIKLIN